MPQTVLSVEADRSLAEMTNNQTQWTNNLLQPTTSVSDTNEIATPPMLFATHEEEEATNEVIEEPMEEVRRVIQPGPQEVRSRLKAVVDSLVYKIISHGFTEMSNENYFSSSMITKHYLDRLVCEMEKMISVNIIPKFCRRSRPYTWMLLQVLCCFLQEVAWRHSWKSLISP